ncbi:MAG: PD40 domain-containing protein [Anaerolineae bacterium]|nr:PD40 domain-containing protein [Anaerolineae bacterium]
MHSLRRIGLVVGLFLSALIWLQVTGTVAQDTPFNPIIDRVEVFNDFSDPSIILQRIYFRDPDANTNLVDFDIVATTASGIQASDGSITPTATQMTLNYHEGRWNCGTGVYSVTLSVRMLDRSGNESNTVEYTMQCGQPNDFVVQGASASGGRVDCIVSTNTTINARLEPSTSADPLQNGLQPGDYNGVAVTTGSDGFRWYQLDFGFWVREDIVRLSSGCASLGNPPTSTPRPAPTSPPTPVPATEIPAASNTSSLNEFCASFIDGLILARDQYTTDSTILAGYEVGVAMNDAFLCSMDVTCEGITAASELLEQRYYYDMSSEEGIAMVNAALNELAVCFPEAAALVDSSFAPAEAPAFTEDTLLVILDSPTPAFVALNLEGEQLHRYDLGDDILSVTDPVWSPDGEYIAFTGQTTDGQTHIFVMFTDGTGLRNLTREMTYSRNTKPAWSPDSQQIAFISDNGSSADLYLVSLSGPFRQLTRDASVSGVTWSPDGGAVAFSANTSTSAGEDIFIRMLEDRRIDFLARTAGDDFDPVWSPDGRRIAFTSNRDGTNRIYVMNSDGTNQTRVSPGDAFALNPTWSPDGSQIAFDLQRSGQNTNVYYANLDGSNLQWLPSIDYIYSLPAWHPDGLDHLEVVFNFESIPTSTPYPTLVPPTSTPLPPTIIVQDLPTTAIHNGNASQLSLIGTIPLPVSMDIAGISADRSLLVIGGSVIGSPQQLYAYDLINLRLIELPNAEGYNEFTQPEIAISPDGSYIAYPNGSTVTVYGTAERRVVATLRGHTETVQTVAFSPTGLTMATAGSDEAINLWEVGSWMLSRSFQRSDLLDLRADSVYSLAFSPNGQALLAGTYANVDLWDVASGQLVGSMGSSVRSGVIAVTFGRTSRIMISPAAAALVGLTEQGVFTGGSWSGSVVDVWNLQNGNVTAEFTVDDTTHFDVNEGANLLVTEDSGGFNVYSFFTTERLFTGTGSYSYPTRVYFARNDTLLVVVKENEIQLWGVQ